MIFPCQECQTLWDGWRDYQAGEPYRGWIQQQGLKQSVESRKAKAKERRDLIIRQSDMIADSCRRNCPHMKGDAA